MHISYVYIQDVSGASAAHLVSSLFFLAIDLFDPISAGGGLGGALWILHGSADYRIKKN